MGKRTKNVLDFFSSIRYITNMNNEQQEENMIHNNAYYIFIINMGIVLFTAWVLNLYAIYVDENKKKNNRTKNVLD